VGDPGRWHEVHNPWTHDPWRGPHAVRAPRRGARSRLDTPPPDLRDSGRMVSTDLHTLQTNDSLTVVAA